VTFEISVEELKFYNSELKYVADRKFQVFVGTDSSTDNEVGFELNKVGLFILTTLRYLYRRVFLTKNYNFHNA
jgi:hypothetical protein